MDQLQLPASKVSTTSDEHGLRLFVGPNADRYLPQWQGAARRFHWPAFLFGPFWFLYRKMRVFAALYAVALILVLVAGSALPHVIGEIVPPTALLMLAVSKSGIHLSLLVLGFATLAGWQGDALYGAHVRRRLAVAPAARLNDADIAAEGGVSWLAPLGLALTLAAIVAIVARFSPDPLPPDLAGRASEPAR